MITLTSPPTVNSILGGISPIPYEKLALTNLVFNTANQIITGTIKLNSTSNPDMQAISGNLTISIPDAKVTVQVAQLDFYRQMTMTGPQSTFVQGLITGIQNDIEAGFISFGIAQGVQAPGV